MNIALDVTEETFDAQVLASSVPVLVDFWAEWCAPCRAVSPILERIASESAGRLRLVKVDIDENPFLAERYQIASVPTMKVFVDGEDTTTIVGAKTRPALEADLARFLK